MYLVRISRHFPSNRLFLVASLGCLVPGRVLDGGTQWWKQGGISFFCLLFLFWFTEQGSLIPGRVGLATLPSGGTVAPGKIGPVPPAEARTIPGTIPLPPSRGHITLHNITYHIPYIYTRTIPETISYCPIRKCRSYYPGQPSKIL